MAHPNFPLSVPRGPIPFETAPSYIKRLYGHFVPVTSPILERGMLYLQLACSGLWLEERGILHLKRTK